MSERKAIYTIGHSTRSLEEFLALLKRHGITHLADIRTVPRSRRHPHFAGDALSTSLQAEGIVYRHFPGLGGLRKPRADSPNVAWRHEGFRGYADYMETAEFEAALDELLAFGEPSPSGGGAPRVTPSGGGAPRVTPSGGGAPRASRGGGAPRVVMMCAEAVWWRCHRQLVADGLVARGLEVRHIVSAAAPAAHTLTSFARVSGGRVTYRGLLA
jgi:uncharacterized protein (DUF488 family)